MPTISLAELTAGVTLDEAKQQRAEAQAYALQASQKGVTGMELKVAQGYLALCDLRIDFIEEQLA
jgi:hypothetical protein